MRLNEMVVRWNRRCPRERRMRKVTKAPHGYALPKAKCRLHEGAGDHRLDKTKCPKVGIKADHSCLRKILSQKRTFTGRNRNELRAAGRDLGTVTRRWKRNAEVTMDTALEKFELEVSKLRPDSGPCKCCGAQKGQLQGGVYDAVNCFFTCKRQTIEDTLEQAKGVADQRGNWIHCTYATKFCATRVNSLTLERRRRSLRAQGLGVRCQQPWSEPPLPKKNMISSVKKHHPFSEKDTWMISSACRRPCASVAARPR